MNQTDNAPLHLVVIASDKSVVAGVELFKLDALVPSNLRWFAGHFPGSPVLPGAAQVAEAMNYAAVAWPDLGAARGVSRLKFRAPIGPADRVSVCLRRTPGQARVAFEFSRSGTTCALGTLEYGEMAPPSVAPPSGAP